MGSNGGQVCVSYLTSAVDLIDSNLTENC